MKLNAYKNMRVQCCPNFCLMQKNGELQSEKGKRKKMRTQTKQEHFTYTKTE